MLHTLKKYLPSRQKPSSMSVPRYTEADLAVVPRYPPFREGLPAAPVDIVLQTQHELLGRIRMLLGISDDLYEDVVAPVISRYAEFVHLLPASEAHHHRGAGGLLRHGLEVGFWSAQFSLGQIFPFDGPPRLKRAHEQRWLFAAFLAGLAHDLGKPLADMEVTDEQGDSVWSPYMETLSEWAAGLGAERYFVRWRSTRVHKRHEEFTLTILKDIAGRRAMEFLSEHDPELLPALFQAVGGTTASGTLARLVMRADQESVKRDLQNVRLDPNEISYGEPAEKYLFDAMRSLVSSGAWKANQAGAAVWVLEEGIFIAWQSAMSALRDALHKLGAKGIPTDPGKIADLLIERGYALGRQVITEDGEVINYRYWPIKAPVSTKEMGGEASILALRLESAKLVFPGEVPAPQEGAYIDQNTQIHKATAQPQRTAPESGAAEVKPGAAGSAAPAPSLAQAQEMIKATAPSASASAGGNDVEQEQPAAQPEAAEPPADGPDSGQELPVDFPDMVKALMATEPPAPPLRMAPEQPGEIAEHTDESTAADRQHSAAAGCVGNLGKGANDPAQDKLAAATRTSTKQQRAGTKPRPVNADILGGGGKTTLRQDLDLLRKKAADLPGHQSVQTAALHDPVMNLPVRVPQQKLQAAPKPKRSKSASPAIREEGGAAPAPVQSLAQAFSVYGQAGAVVLKMLQSILDGEDRIGTCIDKAEGLFCVRASAFANIQAWLDWYGQAADSGMIDTQRGGPETEASEHEVAVLVSALQQSIGRAIEDLERSLDPFADHSADPGPADPVPSMPPSLPERQSAGDSPKRKPRRQRKAPPVTEAVREDPVDKAGPGNEPVGHDAQIPFGLPYAATGQQEPVAAAIQLILETSQPQTKLTARAALDQLVQQLIAGAGDWLVDPRADGDVLTIDMSRSFDRIVAHGQCGFSKAALRFALNSHRKLARKNGRIWLKG